MASFLQIFFDPPAVFARVKERGLWAAPLVAITLLTMLFGYYVTRTIGMENITRRLFDEHPSFVSQLPADKREEVIRQSASTARVVMGSVSGGIVVVVTALLIAAILMIMMVLMDRKLRFAQMLGTVAWAWFPFTVIACVMGVLILSISRNPAELDPQALLATNVGAFLEKSSTGNFLYSVAGSLDVLAIGKVLLLSYGVAKVGGLPFGRSLALVMGLWVVWVLLRGGMAAATGF